MDPVSFNSLRTPGEESPEARIEAIQEKLRKLERRDWWLWSVAIVVMLLLTVAVVSMTFPGLLAVNDPFFQFSLNQAVRGLVALVLLFNAYSVYQQSTIKRLRREFSQQLQAMRNLQIRAQEFQHLAITDPLTGLANRRSADLRLQVEAARSRRHGHPLTLVAFDLNNFKQINDRYGHPAGDCVLKEFAQRLSGVIRLSDLAVRTGGDEFLWVLPECLMAQVPILLARLRPMFADFQGISILIEFSVGCVSYEQGEEPERFLERADQTLYADKRAGKAQKENQLALS